MSTCRRALAPLALALALAWTLALALAGCGSHSHGAAARAGKPAGHPVSTPKSIGADVPIGCTPIRRLYTETVDTPTKEVALTFDDGPSGYTHHVLDVLERERVHATFFLIGNQVRDYPGQVRRELRDGDFVGNHTYTHPDMLQVSFGHAFKELGGAQQAIWQATGFTPCFWRAPYGSIDDALKYLARSFGMVSIQWDTDPQDFTEPPAAEIYRRVLFGNPKDPDPGVHPGAIVLMHDGGGNRSHTVQALPRIVDALRARGYRFVTIPGLLHIEPRYAHEAPARRPASAGRPTPPKKGIRPGA
jgi:peptidoglycan/xylan/chitin deacetylase (PgdA/CDA1 family)